jgi:uncharacterized damage-inducible protein DinB
MTLDADFRLLAAKTLRQHMGRIEICVASLTEDQIWARGSQNENAIGNLCLHLAGNVGQWILSALGGEPDLRTREAEFAARSGVTGAELTARLRDTIDTAIRIVEALSPDQLAAQHVIQNYQVTALGAVFHVVEHFAQHTAQIILLTKIFTGADLGFYRHLSTRPGERAVPLWPGKGSGQVP